jgi:ubiquinone/menaquinone biosynthesis C-methylase UbiE
MSFRERIEFWGISFMHDTMYGLFMDAETLLKPAGVKEGQKILEAGCGPGFFTIPAAEMVGEKGTVYAIDINPFAIKKVKKKITKKNINNVEPLLLDVTNTKMPEKSIDIAFFFGVIHSLTDCIDEVLSEMERILADGGILAIQKSRKKKTKEIIGLIEQSKKFKIDEETKRVLRFKKMI